MKTKDKEKTCENCRYFLQHYIKDTKKLLAIYCGHCTNVKNKKTFKKVPHKVCEFWEDNLIVIEERRASIKETLYDMSLRLNEIAMILKDDND